MFEPDRAATMQSVRTATPVLEYHRAQTKDVALLVKRDESHENKSCNQRSCLAHHLKILRYLLLYSVVGIML